MTQPGSFYDSAQNDDFATNDSARTVAGETDQQVQGRARGDFALHPVAQGQVQLCRAIQPAEYRQGTLDSDLTTQGPLPKREAA